MHNLAFPLSVYIFYVMSQKVHKNRWMETAIVVPDQKWVSLVDADCLVVSVPTYNSPLSSQCFPVTSVLSCRIKGI